MKGKGTLRSSRAAGKASLVKKRATGICKVPKTKKKLKMKKRASSFLNLADVADKRVRKKREENDVASSSVENFSFPSCSTGTGEPSYHPQTSFAPLIIDSPADNCDKPAFSIMDSSFETSEVDEVVVPRVKKVKQTKRKRSSTVESTSEQDKEIQLFPIREWGLLVAVLPHPLCIKFVGSILIQVFSGSVKILGYVVDQFHDILPAFSSSKVLSLDIKTESTENICVQSFRLQNVKNVLLKNKVPEDLADKILDSCDNTSVIVGFRRNFRASDIRFVSSLMPNVFLVKKKKKKNDVGPSDFKILGSEVCLESSTTLEFPECENCISDVISSIMDSGANGHPAPRIVVQGDKGLGKSTLLRYMINRVLQDFDAVYYLDGDPGQSEFTPAGCVSLVKVTAPLLGPAFTHQTTPEKLYFIGTVSIQEIPNKYSACVQLLCDYYTKNCSHIPLFVNTMGWVIGIGLKLLEKLKSYVAPTHVVKVVDDDVRRRRVPHNKGAAPAEPVYSAAKEFTYQRFAPVDHGKQLMNPAERRDLSILAYLGKCQDPYDSTARSLMSITPYCVAWKDLALYIEEKYATEHMLYSFNGTWVALLSVDPSLIMECDDPVLPKLLPVEPVGQECYGFGVIRAIDLAKKVFYIITPEPEERLEKVNAIMKGLVHLPAVALTSQVVKKQIPYVCQVVGTSSMASKHVSRRKFRP